MANYFLNDDGSLTKKKKKVKGKSYVMDASGRITLESSDEVAPVKTTKKKEKRTWFDTGAFDNGYQFGDLTKTIVGTANDIQSDAARGVARIGEGLIDTGAYLAGGTAKLFGNDDFSDDMKKFIARDLNEEYHISDRTSNNTTIGAINNIINGNFKALNPFGEEAVNKENFEKNSVLGDKSDSLVQSAGQLAGTIALQSVGVPWQVTTGITSFGGETQQAFNSGATYGEAGFSAVVSTAAELLTESLFKIPGIKATGSGTLGKKILGTFGEKLSSTAVRNLANWGISLVGEGSEEVITSFFQRLGQSISYEREETIKELMEDEEKRDAYVKQVGEKLFGAEARAEYGESFIGGAVMGGAFGSPRLISSNKAGRDIETGLTDNEQKIVDKEIENRKEEAQKEGKKLSNKEITKIEEEVKNDLQKGYISTDLIESEFGGEEYKSYKSILDKQNRQNELLDKKSGETSNREKLELEALTKELDGVDINTLKSKLDSSMGQKIAKDDFLKQSYLEKAKRSVKYNADLSKYDAKQQEVIKKAIDSGILNDTRKTHEFVDMVAKISADKGVSFDFANNQKLKESGFAVEGKQINGFVDKNGITLNIDSSKALNKVVGHEITHVLEGTELYTELEKALMEYDITKKEYGTRYNELKKLYKGVKDADIKKELTADLVGDYIFNDPDFVNNLSVKQPNAFKKIYDEIKYLFKIATAGSKEARQLEKVKHTFDKAYKQNASKTSETGTKYSISDNNTDLDMLLKNNNLSLRKNGSLEYKNLDEKQINQLAKIYQKNGYSDVSADYLKESINRGSAFIPRAVADDFIKKVLKYTPNYDTTQIYEDAEGNPLTKEQVEFYKDSDVRDIRGRLIPVYHRTNSDFTVFDSKAGKQHGNKYGKGFYFSITPENYGNRTIKAYLNAKEGEYKYVPSMGYYVVQNNNAIKLTDNVKPTSDPDIRYSLSDNQGRTLTEYTIEKTKNSKVRDENGNLMLMYHGSPDGTYDQLRGGTYFTSRKEYADGYQWEGASSISYGKKVNNPRTYEAYLNITNPFTLKNETAKKIYLNEYIKGGNSAYFDPYTDYTDTINNMDEIDWVEGEDLKEWLQENHPEFDGLFLDEGGDGGYGMAEYRWRGYSAVPFSEEQIIKANNNNTEYSLSNPNESVAPVRGDVFGSDIKLQVEEAIAPLKEEIAELKEELASTVEETYKPTTMDDLEGWETQTREDLSNIERDIAPIETEQTYDYMPDTISMDKKSLNTLSKNIKKELNLSKVQTTELESIIQDISNSETATKEDLFDAIQERFSEQTIEYKNEELVNIKRDLRKYRIYVDDYLKSEFRDGFNKIRQQNFNKLKFTNDGSSVDSVYQELSEIYPAYFPNDINNAQDQLQRIIDVANEDVIDVEKYVLPEESIQEITDYIYDSIQDYKLDQHIKSGEEARKLPIDESLLPPVVNDSNTKVNKDNAPVRRNVDWDSIEDTSKGKQVTFNEETQALEEEDLVKKTKKELRKALLGTEAQKEFITNALDNAKNRSMALMNNTDTIRNTELVFGRDAGKVINEFIFQKEIDNEADSIAWQNKERQEIKDLGIKARSKESAAVQKYGEKQYVNDAGEVIAYGDTELANEFSDIATQMKIKRAAQVIRDKYDNYIDRANDVLTKLGFDPIPKRKDYMRHFQELTDVFSNFGIPFNAKSMAEHELPTDINGLTENWSPQKNYFASMQQRKGLKTNYDAITGVDGYIGGIANLIYHTEDIQRGRAFEELIRETYGQDKGFENLENLPDELKQARAEKIQDNHLSNYAAWLHEWTNHVAGKKNKIDRSIESMFGRKGFSFLDNARKQVGANMIGFNLSSSLTNLIAPVQAAAKTNKLAVLKGTADTIKNIFVKDNFMDNNKFLTSRMGSDMISKNAWQKMQDAGFIFMKGMDWFSSNQIVRSKYYELRAKGMSEQQAHAEAGQFAARILGDRTKGANAQLYNSKLVGLVTQFQLEVNNQLYSMFYDTYHESKENAQNNALKTAAGMTFTLGQLFAFTHLFGKTFEAIAGYNPTLDVIGILATALGWGEDDDEEKTTSERLKDAADQLVDALPYVNILTGGGRIPVASGIPNLVGVATGGKDEYGNELTLEDELKKLLFLLPPTGGNQVKKTTQGLAMFDEDLPVKGSYTDSGNLRYPVEDTTLNRVQAALFGQYANKNARDYFDNERAPLKEKQIQEYKDLGMPISDYWEYRDGLKEQKTTEEKFDYINSLDVSNEQKNIMINNVVDRKEAVDMSNYGAFGSYEEFDFATKNPEKYKVIQQIGSFDNYITYQKYISDIKERYSSEKGYSTAQRKAAVQQYIESLNLSIPQKIMLEKMAGGYSIKGYEEYMFGYIESLNMTAKEKQALHDELFN